jgi:hypothetical protein
MHRTGLKPLFNQMDEEAKRKDAKIYTEQQGWAQRLALAHPWANRKESLCNLAPLRFAVQQLTPCSKAKQPISHKTRTL